MKQKTPWLVQWNLEPALEQLKKPDCHRWRTAFEHRLDSSDIAHGSADKMSLFRALTDLDQELSAIFSARTLLSLSDKGARITQFNEEWLNLMAEKLMQHCHSLACAWCQNENIVEEPASTWCEVILKQGIPASILTPAKALTRQWHEGALGLGELLLQRKALDPNRQILQCRLRDNDLPMEACWFSEQYQQESQQYFSQLCGRSGKKKVDFNQIHDSEQQGFAVVEITLDQCLRLFERLCERLGAEELSEVQSMQATSRIQVTEKEGVMDLCLDTPFGSYIQLSYFGNLDSAVRLAHELGHAMHQHLHRNSATHCLPIGPVESETWAMVFESEFLETLEQSYPKWRESIQIFRAHRRIEMNHRHRMLAQFELAVLDPAVQSVREINDIWLALNRSFYGPYVQFDNEYGSAWEDIHHLATSPFYLLSYHVAKERSESLNTIDLVRKHTGRKEVK